MKSSHLTLVISILFFTLLYPVSPSGILEVRLLHFSNPEGKGANGKCCDQTGYWLSYCAPCDHVFVICIDGTGESSNYRSCGISRLETGRIKSYDNLGDNVKNPLHFKFKTWPDIVKIKVTVLDYDNINVQEGVDHFEYQFPPSGRRDKKYSISRVLNMTGSISSISLQLTVHCDSHYYGHDCNTFCMKTNSQKGHYICEKGTGRKICHLGWTGKDCLQNQDDCLYNRCHKGATCIDGLAFYKCQCPPGRTGILCNTVINQCDSDPCLHGGTCKNRLDSFQCVCPAGYTGTSCETPMLLCQSGLCLNGGTCIHTSTSFSCLCTEFFEGRICEARKPYKHTCDRKPCHNGKCIPGSNPVSYTCRCFPGYKGKDCESKINQCWSNPCQNRATCVGDVNAFHCVCYPGYTGRLCEMKIRPCESNPCQNGGYCVAGVSFFVCRCLDHFDGERCELDTRLLDPCQSSPCQNGGHCIAEESGNDFMCICKPQNSGIRCENILPTRSTVQNLPTTQINVHSTSSLVPGRNFTAYLLISRDSSSGEMSTSQMTTLRPSEYSTDHGQSFTSDSNVFPTENETLLETTMPDTEAPRTINMTIPPLTDSGLASSTSHVLFSGDNSLPDATTIAASHSLRNVSETTDTSRSSSDHEELFLGGLQGLISGFTPLREEVTEVIPEISLTNRFISTPETKDELFSSDLQELISGDDDGLSPSGLRVPLSDDTSIAEDEIEVTTEISPVSGSITTPETKEELFSSGLHLLISGNSSPEEDVTGASTEIFLTSRSITTPETKEELFSSGLHLLISGNSPPEEDVTGASTEIFLTSRSITTPETKEELFSSDPRVPLSDDTSIAEDVTDVTTEIFPTSGSITTLETIEDLFSSSLSARLSDNTSIAGDVTEVIPNTSFTTEVDENSTSSLEMLISGQSPLTEATTNDTSLDVSKIMSNFSTDTFFYSGENTTLPIFPISTLYSDDMLSLAENRSTSFPLRIGRKDYDEQTTDAGDNVTTYYPEEASHFTEISVTGADINLTLSNTTEFSQSDLTSAMDTNKTDFVTTDETHTNKRLMETTPRDDKRDKQLKTLAFMITSKKFPAKESTTLKIPVGSTTISKILGRQATTPKIRPRRTTTPKILVRQTTTPKVPARRTTTPKILPRRTTTPKISARQTTTRKILPRRTVTPKLPARRTTTQKILPRRTTTPKISVRQTTTQKILPRRTTTKKRKTARRTSTPKIPARQTTTTKIPARQTTAPKIPVRQKVTRSTTTGRTRRTSVSASPKTRKSQTKTTTSRTTTVRLSDPEICILVKIRPTLKVPKEIDLMGPTENQTNSFTNPDTTRRICWALKRETDFVFPAARPGKPFALDLNTPINWVNQILLSMIPDDDYVFLIKEAVISWVRKSLTIFLNHQHTNVPKHIYVFNSTCVNIVIKPKRIGGTASRISPEKNQEVLKMAVCRSAEPPTTPPPTTTTTKSHHGLIIRIKVKNATHEEKKTIYPGKPTVVIRVVTTAQKAVEYGREVATKVYRKTKILLHKTLRRLSGVWKGVKKISEKFSEPAAASREAVRKVWNNALANAQKAYERTQLLVRRAYQKARETFTRYINNIKAKGADAYKRTYQTYLNYYNDYTKRVRNTAKVFRKNYDSYMEYLRNYWKKVAN